VHELDCITSLYDMFAIKIVLLQGDVLSPFLFKVGLVCDIRREEVNQYGLTLNGTHQLLVYAHDVDIFDGATYYKEKHRIFNSCL